MNGVTFIFAVFMVILVVWPCHVDATSRMTPEQLAVRKLATAARAYSQNNAGQSPTNWSQLEQILDVNLINHSLERSSAFPIQSNYVFLGTKLTMIPTIPGMGYEEGEALMVRLTPGKRDGKKGRYVVYRQPSGLIDAVWVAEEKFARMLAQTKDMSLIQALSSRTATSSPAKWATVVLILVIGFGLAYVFLLRTKKFRVGSS